MGLQDTVPPDELGGADARYPDGTMRRLLPTDLVTPITRDVLAQRIAAGNTSERPEPRFFDAAEFATLVAACARLVHEARDNIPVVLAGLIDSRLARGGTDGWRHDSMPPDWDTYRRGLRGLHETAGTMFGDGDLPRFDSLDADRQDVVLHAVQRGEAPGATWRSLSARLFFEELLSETVQNYYGQPSAQDEIGYAGYADALGWERVGLDSVSLFEPHAHGGREELREVPTGD